MSFPATFLDELRTRLTLSEIVGRRVTWDRRRSNPARGDYWAPCPFHEEKTPSFHVDDRKGFYYCFGCHAKGDAISFVQETQNLSFVEAVEQLAREAGLALPERRARPEAAAATDRRARLYEVMEEAVRAYRLAFRSAAGQAAREYVARRGLSEAALARFEIGYAPEARHHLAEMFRARGRLEEAVAAGLLIRPEDGGAPFDRFRGRLMFPIRDARGRCIAFGGRALDPAARAKYLNSPETEIFSKRRALYNLGPAREAAAKAGTVIVAEGYMDVIALAEAGFANAVAPLGTAITEEQLALLWRLAEEPVIALDADESGLRAAERLIDLALPHLVPGRSLRFCLLPEGRDPDDLIRAEGPAAMAAALAAARPLVDMLWQREVARAPLDTPERRAALDRRLREAIGRIGDGTVRAHYEAEIRARRAELFARPRAHPGRPGDAGRVKVRGSGAPFARGRAAWPLPETRRSELARSGGNGVSGTDRGREARIREAGILLIAFHNPQALEPVEGALEEMTLRTPEYAPLRDALLAALAEGEDPVARALALIGRDPRELLGQVAQARAHPLARPGRPPERVAEVLAEAIALHQAALAYEAELAEAARELADAEGEDWTWRVLQAGRQLAAAGRQRRTAEEEAESVSEIQRMLEKGAYRRKKKTPPLPNR